MSDRYVHLYPFAGQWDYRQDNLVTLARHLILNARAIRDQGGLAFGEDMASLPLPDAAAGTPLPPLAHGPAAGLPLEPGEDWPTYCQRVFGIYDHRPTMVWLQSPMWLKTEPSPQGSALRIGYMLDYGVPHDHVEIAMGQAHTDYESNGFLWEKLDLSPLDDPEAPRPLRQWPAWIGAVEQERQRAAIKTDFLLPPGEVPFSHGFGAANLRELRERTGPLPATYNDFLLLSGRRDDGNGPYADRLEAINRTARNRIVANAQAQDDPVPADAIFIDLEDTRHPLFILSGARPDTPVFRFDTDTGKVTPSSISIYPWIATFMERAARVPERPTLVPSGPNPPSLLDRLLGLFR